MEHKTEHPPVVRTEPFNMEEAGKGTVANLWFTIWSALIN